MPKDQNQSIPRQNLEQDRLTTNIYILSGFLMNHSRLVIIHALRFKVTKKLNEQLSLPLPGHFICFNVRWFIVVHCHVIGLI